MPIIIYIAVTIMYVNLQPGHYRYISVFAVRIKLAAKLQVVELPKVQKLM